MSMSNRSGTFEIGGEVEVRRLGFGAMRITGEMILGPPEDEAAARDLVRSAVGLGVDLVDTADSYGPGSSERLLGEALDPDDAVVATKAGLLRNSDGDWTRHAPPDYVRNQALVSIDRLGVDSIDLYQLHAPDPDTPYEESVQAFAELKDEGLVDHVGVSNVNVELLEEARDHVEVVTVQNEYNVENRAHEDVLEACEELGIGFLPYFPLSAGGFGDAAGVLDDVAEAHDATPHQVALAWLLRHSEVTLPIPGTSDPAHLEQNVASTHIELSDDEYARLSEVAG